MSITGLIINPVEESCAYIPNYTALMETVLVRTIDLDDMDLLLSRGFRHFGEIFFRPICAHCRGCIPVRIPAARFRQTPSVRRLLSRAAFLTVQMEKLAPSQETFLLYKKHKKRFTGSPGDSESDYDHYVRSFFFSYPFSETLTIRDEGKLVAVSHLDVTQTAISAIYCYYDTDYPRFSLGKLAVYKELELAAANGREWLYLGFYVHRNRHMAYKTGFRPNQLMVGENDWRDYVDESGRIVMPLPRPAFTPLVAYRLPPMP